MKRILVVVRNLKKGVGISEFVINNYNELSNYEDLEIEILVEEASNLGDFNVNPKLKITTGVSLSKNPVKYVFYWNKLRMEIKKGKYDIIHLHTDNFVRFINIYFLKNFKNFIIHSHNSYNNEVQKDIIKRQLHFIGKKIVKNSRAQFYSCSDLAAEWLFDDRNYTQINNGIDLKKFQFNKETRIKYRKKLNLNGKTVYGHIGRFMHQKNHEKLIGIFSEIVKKEPNSFLILIGEGEKMNAIKKMVSDLGLSEKVAFLGLRKDVGEIMNALDSIIFPSFYEGFPIVLVEGQANGLPVYFSSTITKDASILEQSHVFNLNDSNKDIAELIVDNKKSRDRIQSNKILKEKHYSQEDTINKLHDLYKRMD